MELKGVSFDFDGTLANTIPVCCTAFRQVFKYFLDRDYTNQEIIAMFGPTEEGIIRQQIPEQWEMGLKRFRVEYKNAHSLCSKPFPGIDETLKLLKRAGALLAVITGKGEWSVSYSLQYLRLAEYFDSVEVGSAKGAAKPDGIRRVIAKWNLLPKEVAYVGDSPYDMSAAREVGTIPLGAAWSEGSSFERLNKIAFKTFRKVGDFTDWLSGVGFISRD